MFPHDHAPRLKRHAPLMMTIGIVLLVCSRPPRLLVNLIPRARRNLSQPLPLPQRQLACKYCVGSEYFRASNSPTMIPVSDVDPDQPYHHRSSSIGNSQDEPRGLQNLPSVHEPKVLNLRCRLLRFLCSLVLLRGHVHSKHRRHNRDQHLVLRFQRLVVRGIRYHH